MINYTKYINQIEHIWYDSTNVVYSACYDKDDQYKTIKVVFKGGRTYIYKNVDVNDYIMFARGSESTGEAFNKYIVKKYKGIRIEDTDLEKLNEIKEEYIEQNTEIEKAMSNLAYEMQIDDKTGRFRLLLNNNTMYEGIEGEVSIMRLFNAMHIGYKLTELTDDFQTEKDFEDRPLDKKNSE